MGAELLTLEEAYIGTLSGRQPWKCLNACIRRSDRRGRRRLWCASGRSRAGSAANAPMCSTQGGKVPAPPDMSGDFHKSLQRCWRSREAARGFLLLSSGHQAKESIGQSLDRNRLGSHLPNTCRRAGGLLALSAVVIVTPTPPEAWADLCRNYVFRAGFWGWFTAQTAKAHPRPHYLNNIIKVPGSHSDVAHGLADIHTALQDRRMGPDSLCGLGRHAVVALRPVHGALSRASHAAAGLGSKTVSQLTPSVGAPLHEARTKFAGC